MANKILTPCQKRCKDCVNLKIKNGQWFCEECFGHSIEEIDDCPEGFTLEEVQKIIEEEKENHVKLVSKSEHKFVPKTEKTPRPKRKDEVKEKIISEIAESLKSKVENLEITNVAKVIEFDFQNEHYKIDLSRQNKNLKEKKEKEQK